MSRKIERKTSSSLTKATHRKGISNPYIVIDKAPGKKFHQTGYKKKFLKPKDALLIQSLDRLGRSYEEVPVGNNMIIVTKKVSIKILDIELLNLPKGEQ